MLHVHRAAHAGRLVDALADLLAQPADVDPFMPEVVAVPSRGIERWLAQELSLRLGATPGRRDGVCANVHFPFPATVVGWALRAAEGGAVDVRGRDVPDDPWSPARLTWHLLDVVAAGGAGDLGAFGAHLAGEHGMARRLPALRHVADLFDRYAVHRPDMVRAWLDGRDVDGAGGDLPDTAGWQPRLWRAVRQHLDAPSYAERVSEAVAHLDARGPVPGVPSRLALYGLTALPATHVEVLDALAAAHDVHLFLLHPSPALWQRMSDAPSGGRVPRESDETRTVPRHPLVASWGRDARELQVVLAGRGVDHPHDPPTEEAPQTLLARLQSDIVEDRAPVGGPVGAAPDDRWVLPAPETARAPSLAVHGCHGRLRQVEVMRDAILHLLDADPTLQPRDVVVMCPDIEAFAPLVAAVFGADVDASPILTPALTPDTPGTTSGSGLPDIRVRLADRALRSVNPLLRTVADLLMLPDSRVEASLVVDLLHREPVRRRFGLDDDDLDTIEGWIDALLVRWGLDLDHRRSHGVGAMGNTWQEAMDRLLVGVAVAEDGPRLVGDVLPFDDVEGGDVVLAGRLAELLARIGHAIRLLHDDRPVEDWCAALRDVVDLLTATGDEQAWQRVQFDALLDALLETAGGDDASSVPVARPELRTLLGDRLRGRPSRANHRTGDLTVCTLVPMRSVPFRVVGLLGLDDGVFPRVVHATGDDLVGRDPLVGDRDARSEDRQLLLDAVLAAEQHLVVTYGAMHERTNAELPPCVPLAELLDTIDATARTADGRDATDEVVVMHPLRAADPANFRTDPAPTGRGPERRGPFSYDRVALDGADAAQRPFRQRHPFVARLPAALPPPTMVELAALVRFLEHPSRGYVNDRLGLRFPDAPSAVEDHLPVDLAVGLPEWQVGDRLLRAAGQELLDAAVEAERRRGTLAVGRLADQSIADLRTTVEAVHAAAVDACGPVQRVDPVEVDVEVDGVRLVGRVSGLVDGVVGRRMYSKPSGKYLLRLWLDWLALSAAGHTVRAALVGRGEKKGTVAVVRCETPLDPGEARARIAVLLDLYRAGLAAPLPMPPDASPVFVQVLRDKGDRKRAISAAASEWRKGGRNGGQPYGDGPDPYVRTAFDTWRTFDDCLLEAVTDAECGDGWDLDEPTRFGRLALRLWDPVFADLTRGS